jgi:hypothetical protein
VRRVLISENKTKENSLYKTNHMKTIIRNLIYCVLLFIPFAKANAQGQNGEIKVTVLDEKNLPMPGAVVSIVAGGPSMGGQTDLDGNFIFHSLAPGSYDVEARMLSYKKYVKTGIEVSAGQTAYATFPMQVSDCDSCMQVITITAIQSPVDPTFSTVKSINNFTIKHGAFDHGSVVGMVSGTSSQVSEGKGGGLVMRGARETASSTYVDGEIMYGNTGVCGEAINQVTVLSGGIPAEYGDLTGGAVIITTKSYYTGYAAKEAMYTAAEEARIAAEKEAAAKSGKRTENGGQIIEKNAPVPVQAPVNDSIPQVLPH